MNLSSLTAISPIDGRYGNKTQTLRSICSEYGLIHFRIRAELSWLQELALHPEIQELPSLSKEEVQHLESIFQTFDEAAAQRVKAIESTTRHDVKAVEYFLKERCLEHPTLAKKIEFIHFACTSEDINNLAYALMLQTARDAVLLPTLTLLESTLTEMAHRYADTAMLSRTHGQTASPTTVGKEIANTVVRLRRQMLALREAKAVGKINGAVGNYNAHYAAYPSIQWEEISHSVLQKLGLEHNSHTTQIEPHDWLAEWFHILTRIHSILLDFSRDMWGYISLGYFKQHTAQGEVGSSTMPHKVNPIHFENAEGNLGLSNAVLLHLSQKLPVSRWQRDLSDSTVLRNVGVGLAYGLIAYNSLLTGLQRVDINPKRLNEDLERAWEVLAEPIQTVMRRHGLDAPYEQLKALTRGHTMTADILHTFIQGLDLPESIREELLSLTPQTYSGQAADLARRI